jgi:hypothetical protein
MGLSWSATAGPRDGADAPQVQVPANGTARAFQVWDGHFVPQAAAPTLEPAADVRQADAVTNSVNVRRETVLVRDGKLTGVLDTTIRCSLTVSFQLGLPPAHLQPKDVTEPVSYEPGFSCAWEAALPAQASASVDAPADPYTAQIELNGITAAGESTTQFTQLHVLPVPNSTGNAWKVEIARQVLQIGQCSYEMYEIYGKGDGQALQQECVICMCDPRDTTVLPCRHLCLCRSCANILRLQSNRCPICRQPVGSLLQIRCDDTEPLERVESVCSESDLAAREP